MFQVKIQKENLMLLGSSLVIAIFLWLKVHTQIDPISKEGFDLMLHIKNTPDDLIITKKNDRIGIIVEGPISILKTFTLDSVEAYLDLSKAKTGIKAYPVKLNLKDLHGLSVHLKHPTETLTIEKLIRRSIPITVIEKGLPPNEILYHGAKSKPHAVTLIGPASQIKKVYTARTILDLGTLSFNSNYSSNVQPININDEAITNIKCHPDNILLIPSVTPAPIKKLVPINVVWKGTLPFGYHIKSFILKPNKVLISGKNPEISQINSIETLPINLSDLNKSAILKIGFKSISSVQIHNIDTAEIDLNIELLTP